MSILVNQTDLMTKRSTPATADITIIVARIMKIVELLRGSTIRATRKQQKWQH